MNPKPLSRRLKPSIRKRVTKISPASGKHRKTLPQAINSHSPSILGLHSFSPINSPAKTTLSDYFANSPPIVSEPEYYEEDSVINSLNQLLSHKHVPNESISKKPPKLNLISNHANSGKLILHKRPKIQLKIPTYKRQSSLRPNPLFSS